MSDGIPSKYLEYQEGLTGRGGVSFRYEGGTAGRSGLSPKLLEQAK